MTTKTKEVRIGAISLNNNGSNGLVVKYEQTEIRNNREFFTEYSAKKKFPIHQELNDKFLELIPFLLELCNYESDAALMSGTEIVGIKYNDKGFVLSGKMQAIADKTFAINTPLITDEDGYPDFAKVTAIMDDIYAETKEYMEGKKVLSDIQYVINLNKGNAAFDAKTFESLSQEEQWKIASDFMEKNKCIVTKLDDLEEGEEEEPPFEFETLEAPKTEQAPTLKNWNVPTVIEEGVIENLPETTITTNVSDDEFIVHMEPVKESKAKKKVS
jgi:hypothetical protein